MTLEPSAARIAVRWRPVAALKPNPRNARIHSERQVAAIADSIAAFGFNVPLLIDSESRVLAGHGRLLAAKRLGLEEVPTIMLEHLDDAGRRAFMIADNRLAEFASWDGSRLALELKELGRLDLDFALSATGFSLSEIDLRINAPGADGQPAAPVDAPGPDPGGGADRGEGGAVSDRVSRARRQRPIARAGDAWRLGPHRLLCGEGDEAAFLAVDDAIRRWQARSGESARLESTEESFASIARGRSRARSAHAGGAA